MKHDPDLAQHPNIDRDFGDFDQCTLSSLAFFAVANKLNITKYDDLGFAKENKSAHADITGNEAERAKLERAILCITGAFLNSQQVLSQEGHVEKDYHYKIAMACFDEQQVGRDGKHETFELVLQKCELCYWRT